MWIISFILLHKFVILTTEPMERDFIEREGLGGFDGFGDFGELPEDLRGSGAVSMPDGSYIPGYEADTYSTAGGAYRPFMEPIPGALTNAVSFTAVNYLPRANYESFRSQRFFGWGVALLPPDGVFYPLLVDVATLPPSPPQTASSGPLIVPVGYAAVISGIRQFIGDATAFQKSNGQPDDITWRVEAGSTPIFSFGNIPLIMSAMDQEAHLFSIANESTSIQVSARNTSAGSLARNIAIQVILSGHWFPIDEMDDIFRNK